VSNNGIIQGDSFGGDAELIIINHAVIYRWKRNLKSAYVDRCGDTWRTVDAEIGFPPPGHTGGQDANVAASMARGIAD
jgi:hypothetical protein